MLAIGVKALLDWLFVVVLNWGIEGISLATTLITVFNLSLLTFALRRKIGNLGFRQLMPPLTVMFTATVACAAATIGVYSGLIRALHASVEHPIGTLEHLVVIGVASIIGLLIYVGICLLFKLDEPTMFARRLPIMKRFVR
jgi:peptidoglycan biosynthesis protein MviN/MurJ (putative lipid II flippase)